MKMSGNTILVTGATSGIGRALAEAFHARGNTVIVAGRRQVLLDELAAANPGIETALLDIQDEGGIPGFSRALLARFPALNVVVQNAGIMKTEAVVEGGNLQTAEDIVATNLLGPIRLTAALLPHLLRQPKASLVTVSSGLAFVPLAATPTYSATKSAIHAWSIAMREQLKATSTEVIEIAPPYVQTELLGPHQKTDPDAMPLADFIAEVMAILEAGPASGEVVVERCTPLRFAAENGNLAQVFAQLNERHS